MDKSHYSTNEETMRARTLIAQLKLTKQEGARAHAYGQGIYSPYKGSCWNKFRFIGPLGQLSSHF
jgi:hypothetical protein